MLLSPKTKGIEGGSLLNSEDREVVLQFGRKDVHRNKKGCRQQTEGFVPYWISCLGLFRYQTTGVRSSLRRETRPHKKKRRGVIEGSKKRRT